LNWFSYGVALLVAAAIIVLGVMYLSNPRAATKSFGLPLPEEGPNVAWWLRLKGMRDVVSGLVVLAMVAWAQPRLLGVVLLIRAITPIGDMSMILMSKGSVARAFGIHGLTAAVMILGAVPLLIGLA